MKWRIKFREGRWHLREPNGEVEWHFLSLGAACDFVCECTKRVI